MPHPRADALIILGAALAPDGRASPALSRRIAHGASLYHAGAAPVVVSSGGGPSRARGGPTEAEVMAHVLHHDHAVPATALVCEADSRTTLENARFSLALARARGWRRVIVVTDGTHLPRALLTFRRLAAGTGIAVAGEAAPHPAPFRGRWWLTAAREAAAFGFYALRLLRPPR